METLYYEHVTERIGNRVIASNIHVATQDEITVARKLHALGKCTHTIITDLPGWPYDVRVCALCGEGLGAV